MREANMLREQAKVLRDLATRSLNTDGIRDRLLVLAGHCEELAKGRERALAKGKSVPHSEGGKSERKAKRGQ